MEERRKEKKVFVRKEARCEIEKGRSVAELGKCERKNGVRK